KRSRRTEAPEKAALEPTSMATKSRNGTTNRTEESPWRRIMIRFISIVLFVCSSSPAILAQSGEIQTTPPCRIKELVKPGGWVIPGVSKVVVKTHGHY